MTRPIATDALCRPVLSRVAASLVAFAVATPAAGQLAGGPGSGSGRHEAMYGTPVDIGIDDLVFNPETYHGRAVRTRARLDLHLPAQGRHDATEGSAGRRGQFVLRGSYVGDGVLLVAVPGMARGWQGEAFELVGREVEVTGVFRYHAGIAGAADLSGVRSSLEFWNFLGPKPEDEDRKAADVSLEDLVREPGGREGHLVRVVGQFRGRNLNGDLPGERGCSRSDWVIQTDGFAVWVTGRKPSGAGWKLDPASKQDTDKWVVVVGRPETKRGITCLRAIELFLTSAPAAGP